MKQFSILVLQKHEVPQKNGVPWKKIVFALGKEMN
jgi:hypothetical protein